VAASPGARPRIFNKGVKKKDRHFDVSTLNCEMEETSMQKERALIFLGVSRLASAFQFSVLACCIPFSVFK
jgi:hypothetical protein